MVVPHGSSVYSYHFVITRHNSPFAEFLMMHPGPTEVVPMFHPQLIGEPVPEKGRLHGERARQARLRRRAKSRSRMHRPYSTEGATFMKFCRYGSVEAKARPYRRRWRIRDLSGVIADVTVARSSPPPVRRSGETLPVVEGTPRYGVPTKGIGKIVAIGLNYEPITRSNRTCRSRPSR
jgi:hypothetical protein